MAVAQDAIFSKDAGRQHSGVTSETNDFENQLKATGTLCKTSVHNTSIIGKWWQERTSQCLKIIFLAHLFNDQYLLSVYGSKCLSYWLLNNK